MSETGECLLKCIRRGCISYDDTIFMIEELTRDEEITPQEATQLLSELKRYYTHK